MHLFKHICLVRSTCYYKNNLFFFLKGMRRKIWSGKQLFVSWEFHKMYPIKLLLIPHRLILPALPCPSPSRKERKRKIPSQICIAPILIGTWSHSQCQMFKKKNWISPNTPTLPETMNCEELHFSIFITIFKNSFPHLPV